MPSTYLLHVSENCPWCEKAKFLLDQLGKQYETTHDRCYEWSTVPAIYRVNESGSKLIGGYDQLLVEYFKYGLKD